MAEDLLRTVSEVDSEQQDLGELPPSQQEHIHEFPQQTPARKKRAQVTAACQACRRRKIKCDALRPCTSCVRSNLKCHYDTQHGETHPQASKRKHDEIASSHSDYVELFRMLQNRNERDAVEIVRRIQAGHDPKAILRYLKTGDVKTIGPDLKRIALEAFLINLAHSSGSLRDIIRLATLTLGPTAKARLPDPRDFCTLRNRIVHPSYVEYLLHLSGPGNDLSSRLLESGAGSSNRHLRPSANEYDTSTEVHPPHLVPAGPWTNVSTSDEAVSHLVSLFLAWINPTWRFVEQDLFLSGMRSKRLYSLFCSPLLVNSVCAIASLHSEHEVAFVQGDRDRITRGQHFRNEALHLWTLERNRPSLTNVQALCILGLESNYRAKDRVGLTLIPFAAQLNGELPLHGDEQQCADQGISKPDFSRGRLCTHWTVTCIHLITSIAFMSGGKGVTRVSKLPKISDMFHDTVEYWVGYPLTRNAVACRPTSYFQERCRLAGLFQEMHDIIFAGDGEQDVPIREFASRVNSLLAKMQYWYQYLPEELYYEWPMSVAVWELHASYLAFSMVLLVVARSRSQEEQESTEIQATSSSPENDELSFRSRIGQEYLSTAIGLAHKAAQILREFRERYGLKITPAWLLQLQAVTAGVLLADPELSSSANANSAMGDDPHGDIRDSHTAFDEVFRGLLGTGVEVMIARGIARMMYRTALEREIALSSSTKEMLQIMADTAWRPSDLSLVNSVFPNFATTKGHTDSERMTEMLDKWEKLEI